VQALINLHTGIIILAVGLSRERLSDVPPFAGVGDVHERFTGGVSVRIQAYNGAELISKALDKWAYEQKVVLDFSRPGKPTDDAYIESFNGSFRDECLNTHWFLSLDDAREKTETWRGGVTKMNSVPHSALDNMTPEEYVKMRSKTSEISNLPGTAFG
jgi:putative transposase